ncbi:MAG: GGDEF domain-containing protein, partial [Campylobacterota bacterium]|nr:GGDEF domain-containing protein [Campylobacterota bacterium]
MLLPETKEREYRFRLALRMGLPIFALVIAFISHTLINSYETLGVTFYVEAILLLAFSIYFIFYIIYSGFDVKITDEVTKTFTREYLYKYLTKELTKERDYSLVLISVCNLNDINATYGIKNGDKVLRKVASWIGEYLKEKDIQSFPMGHVKGGDFVLGLKGKKSRYKTILELMALKSEEFKIDDIEVQMSATITDKIFSNELDYMIENLFQLQEEVKNKKLFLKEDDINPTELDSLVISCIKQRSFLVSTQSIFQDDKSVLKECFVKLKTAQGKMLYPKSYMKVINRLGLMADFDLMIIEKSIAENLCSGDEIFVISISPTSLRNAQFLLKLKELLNSNKSVKNKIMFVLCEVEYYSHIDRYNTTLKSLRDMGVLIAMDRLGTIHTSFLYLRDLDIDVVRFDGYYAKDIENRNIIEGFNLMAHQKGVKTWIKMIENEDVKKFAQEIGVDYLQGKYLAPLKNYE